MYAHVCIYVCIYVNLVMPIYTRVYVYVSMHMYIYTNMQVCVRVTAVSWSIESLNLYKLSADEVVGSSFDSLGFSLDPLGQVRRSCGL